MWGWLKRLVTLPARRRWGRLLARVDDADARELRRALARPDRRFPAAADRLRLALAQSAMKAGDPAAVRSAVASLRTDWEQQAAERLDRTIAVTLAGRSAGPTEQNAAFDAFCNFRKDSDCLIPTAFPLIVQTARRGRTDPAAARAYIEYLASAPGARPDDAAAVEQALRRACRLGSESAEPLNRLARDVCGRPWAAQNLMQLYHAAGDLDAARAELEAVPALGGAPDDPAWHFRAGLLRRDLREWDEAAACFDRVLAAPDAPERAAAAVYAVEAKYRAMEKTLPRRGGAAAEVAAACVDWQKDLADACAAGSDLALPVAAPLLLQMDRRLNSPRAAWRRLAALGESPYPAELRREVVRLLYDGDAAVEDDAPSLKLLRGRWLLLQGRLADAAAVLKTTPPDDARLLQADYEVRTGRADEVAAGALDHADDLTLEIHVERLLAWHKFADVARLVGGPHGLRLPWLARQLFLADAAVGMGNWRDSWKALAGVLVEVDSPRAAVAAGFAALQLGQDAVARDSFERALKNQPRNVYAQLGVGLLAKDWPTAAAELRRGEPDVAGLAKPWATRLAAAGRLDLTARLRQNPRTRFHACPTPSTPPAS